MKKIIAIAVAVLLCQGAAMAQKLKSVAEKDVKMSYVKDFQRQVKDPTNVEWWQVDSLTFKVTYMDSEQDRQAMVFSNKGSETHYIIDKQYYPAVIKDSVSHMYPGYSIQDLWMRLVRGKKTYQVAIAKKSGCLWWKKLKDFKMLNFEVDGKFINAE